MVDTLLLLLPAALGFALSPIPLIEMILVLLSKRAKSNGMVFLASIALPVFIIPMLSAEGLAATAQENDGPSNAKAWVQLLVGTLLLVMAIRNFANRQDKSVPKIFSAIENMGPAGVVGLSGGATVFNPKNLVILLGAGAVAAESGLSIAQLTAVFGVFTVIATLPFSLAVVYVIAGGDAVATQMQQAKQWLLLHNRMIMAVVLGVLGLVMTAKSVAALLG